MPIEIETTTPHDPETGEVLDPFAPRSFAVFLTTLGGGDAEVQASQELLLIAKAVAAQARAQRKEVKGSLTLKLAFACDEGGVVDVTYAIERKEPKPRRPSTVLWVDKTGNLVTENPKQGRLPIRDVSSKKGPAREVARDEDDEPRTV